jgi:hypothetical protein
MRVIADSLSGKAETIIRMKIVKASSMLVAFSEDSGGQGSPRNWSARKSIAEPNDYAHISTDHPLRPKT